MSDLENAAIVIRNQEGKVKVKPTQELVSSGALGGGFWGLLFGFLFFHKVLEDLSQFEGKVLRTSLSREDEAKLQAALSKGEVDKKL